MKIYPVQTYLNERIWKMMLGQRLLALVYMDYLEQVDNVVLMPNISQEEVIAVLKLAATHVYKYVVDRRHSNGILNVSRRNQRSYGESSAIFYRPVPEIIESMDLDQLTAGLRQIDVDVIWAMVSRFDDAVKLATAGMPVRFKVDNYNEVTQRLRVTFSMAKPQTFRAWHSVGKGGTAFDLYIVPDYHPDAQTSKKSVYLVNGATDALIRGKAIRSVYAPNNPEEGQPNGGLMSSWHRMPHPFYASGTEVSMSISPTLALSKEGIDEIRSVLLALLELEDTYFSVSGGFNSPYDYSGNVAHRKGLRTSLHKGEVRGSEGFCVWAYTVLRDEHRLAGAYVPSWFSSERWLEAYKIS